MEETASLFVLGSFVVACSAKIPRFPVPGESLCAEAFTLEAGGKGFNLMVGSRRLGADVDGLLPVGDDAFRPFAERSLDEAGLPRCVLRVYPAGTGSGVGFINAEGENCLAVHPGANRCLSAADVRDTAPALRRAQLVLAQFEIDDEPILEAFALARAAGLTTLLNPSPFRVPDPRLLELTTILVLNEVEAADLGEAPDRLLALGPESVVVTQGSRGARLFQRNGHFLHQRAFDVPVIDTLGAGDAFTAGLAVSLAEGQSWAESLKRAAGCGALVTRSLGVLGALPTRVELDAFLSEAHPYAGFWHDKG